MEIDYNKVKSFLEVVRCGSVTAAAKKLCRTQSAVSQALRGLEANLGLKLIEWEGKRLLLTRSGELIYRAACDQMSAIEEQIAAIVEVGDEVRGCIEIGILQDHSTPLQGHVFKILSKFREKCPAVSFKIYLGSSSEIEESLLQRKLDIGFLINFRERHRFQIFEVVREEHIIVSSPIYLKQIPPIHDVKDIIGAHLIDIDTHFTCLMPWVQKHAPSLVSALSERNPIVCVDDFNAIKALVLLHQGIATLPKYLIWEEIKNKSIVPILPKLSSLHVGLDCAVELGRKERLCEHLFIETVRFLNLSPQYCYPWVFPNI